MASRILLAALAVLAVAVLLVLAFHGGTSALRQRFCVDGTSNITALDIAINNGITCFRTDIYLNQQEIGLVSNVTASGGDYLGILDYATVGAQPSPSGCISGCNWTLDQWNASVYNAVADYPEVHTWEIWNEPLIQNFVSGYENGSALDYFNMVKSASQIIKSRDPNDTIVCFGGPQVFPFSTFQAEYQFSVQVWSYGASSYCDAVSLHAYSEPYYDLNQPVYSSGATLAQEYNYTLGLMENLTRKPIWVTETGIPSDNWTAGLNNSLQNQATFLEQDMNLFSSHPFVARVYWFHLFGNGSDGDFGLLNQTLQPKPAWYSFLQFAHRGIG